MQSLCSQATAAAQNTATTLSHPHKLTCAHTYISIRNLKKLLTTYWSIFGKYTSIKITQTETVSEVTQTLTLL